MSVLAPLRASPVRGSDQVTEEIRVTRRALREPPQGWSTRTRRVLAGLCVVTVLLGAILVARVITAQGLRAQGHEDAAALTAALDAARADAAALAEAVEAADPVAADARALAEVLAPRAEDLSTAAVDEVTRAVERLTAVVGEPVAEPALPGTLASPAALPGRYVSADGDARSALEEQVAREIDRLGALGERARAQVGELADAVAAVSDAAGAAVRAAQSAAPGILAGGPEATADTRARLETSVAALAALGEAPPVGAETRDAFTAYFAAADAFRRSHVDAVAAREAAERAAEEAAAEEAAREAAEREDPWSWWRDREWPPRRG